MKLDWNSACRSPLFLGIGETDLPKLLECLGASCKTFPKNAAVFSAGDPAEYTGVLLRGSAQVVYEDAFGNRSILGALKAGGLFGEAFSFAGQERLPVSVFTQEESEILLFSTRSILQTCPAPCGFHRRLVENMVRILAQKNVTLNHKIRYLSMRSTREKLLAYLSDQAVAAGGRTFTIPFSRQELADFLCVERSAMSAQLSRLKQEGLLDYTRNRFRLR